MKYKKLFIGCLTALTLFTVSTYSQNTTAFAEETAVSGTYVSDSKEAIINRINEIGNTIKIDELFDKLKMLEKETEDNDFWNNSDRSSVVLSEISSLKNRVNRI